MSATGFLLLIIGIWVLINTINGNIPGLIAGTTKFNLPFNTSTPTASGTAATATASK